MEYIIDYMDRDNDYDSVSIFVNDDVCEEEGLCQLLNEVLSIKAIKEVVGIETIEKDSYEDEEEY